jgi:hypothetical protein
MDPFDYEPFDDPAFIHDLSVGERHAAGKTSVTIRDPYRAPTSQGTQSYNDRAICVTRCLLSLGFTRQDRYGQFRLPNPDRYRRPVQMLLAGGREDGGNFRLNARKGRATLELVKQQERRFSPQFSLFDPIQDNGIDAYWLIVDNSLLPDWLKVYLVLPFGLVDGGRLMLPARAKLVFSGPILFESPDMMPESTAKPAASRPSPVLNDVPVEEISKEEMSEVEAPTR